MKKNYGELTFELVSPRFVIQHLGQETSTFGAFTSTSANEINIGVVMVKQN